MANQVNPAKEPREKPWPVLGLSGGIATGKSTVSQFLQKKGARIIDADEIARSVVEPGTALFEQICLTFQKELGNDLLTPEGKLNRKFLNHKIFSDPNFRKRFENLIHPQIFQEINRQIFENKKKSSTSLIIVSAPLLFESGLDQKCHANLVVSCSPENQRDRLMKRNGYTSEQATLRIQAQMSLEEKIRKADWVVTNDSTRKDLHQHLNQIWPQILSTFGKK